VARAGPVVPAHQQAWAVMAVMAATLLRALFQSEHREVAESAGRTVGSMALMAPTKATQEV